IPDSSYAGSHYSPWPSLKPYFWFLTGFADEQGGTLGAFCLGSDALTQLNYQLSVGYTRDHGRTPYGITLTDSRRPLPLTLSLSDLAVSRDAQVGGIDTAYWERRQTQELGVSYTWRTTRRALTPSLAYRHQRLSGLNRITAYGDPFWTGHLASLRLSCSYSDAHAYGYSISPERGRTLHVEAEDYGRSLGSQIDQHVAWARWTEYLPLPSAHHVLVVDARCGVWQAAGRSHFDDAPAFDLRGYDSGMLNRTYRAAATAEYRCPLLRVERGISTWPLYWKDLHAAAFIETGAQGGAAGDLALDGALWSYGAELRGDWLFSYALPVRTTLGYARTAVRPLRQSIYWSIAIEL
ncbi:MAG TPA: hypothetical protein VMF29_05225, partial [Candidatus Edwardsbacteria bacterium]|nr:hypothetical protein [Candidatus Edwardsbacteria bacterium]